MKHTSNIEDLFYKGQFSTIVQKIKMGSRTRVDPFEIGALCMLGRTEDAELLFKQFKGSRKEKIFCQFWISISAIRVQQFKKTKKILRDFFSLRHQRLSREEQFYVWQLLGFYSFFKGKYTSSIRFAQKAWQKGFLTGKPFLQILALDLRGQANFQMGEVEQGITLLNRAQGIAKKIDDKGLAQTLRNSILLLTSQNIKISTQQLISHIENINEEDTYSKTLLSLELIQRLIFEGQASQANLWLENIKNEVFSRKSQRHIELWKKRSHELAELRNGGGFEQTFVREPRIYQNKIESLIKFKFQSVELKKEFLDQKLLTPFLPLFENQKQCLVIDLIPDSTLIFERGQIFFEMGGFSPQIRGLLLLLLQGPQSGEDIIHKLYGYQYDPIRHDSTVASLIFRLRKRISFSFNWLEVVSGKYRIHQNIKVRFFEQLHEPINIISENQKRIVLGQKSNLSYRQVWAVEKAQSFGWVKPIDLVKEFKVTPMTAFRDLKQLVEQDWLVVRGQGRASHYLPKAIILPETK